MSRARYLIALGMAAAAALCPTQGATQSRGVQTRAATPAASITAHVPTMPSLIDSTLSRSRRMLTRFKLDQTVVTKDTSLLALDTHVFAQSPAAGQRLLLSGRLQVQLSVYRYVPRASTIVPPVVDRNLGDAV